MPPQLSRSPTATHAHREKSTLFCPSCGHESPTDGDWLIRTHTENVVYSCPVCDETVTERPAGQTPPSSASRTQSTGNSLFARTVRLTVVWTAWPYTPEEYALS